MKTIGCFLICVTYALCSYSQTEFSLTLPSKFKVDTVKLGNGNMYKYHVFSNDVEIYDFSISSVLGADKGDTYKKVETKEYKNSFLVDCGCNIVKEKEIKLKNDVAVLYEIHVIQDGKRYFSYTINTIRNQKIYSFIYYKDEDSFDKYKEDFLKLIATIVLK